MPYDKYKDKNTLIYVGTVWEKLDSITDKLESIEETLKKIWKAEDEEAGEYNFPFDEDGNLLPNVSLTSGGEYIEDGKTGD
jgi:hypothetical protein|tara:strand:- start:1244 stop:1486 length:243 start_codon:yes stop_codon:yes gene_type:complete